MTEVYKPYGENLYYYDVNSLYPYVSLQDMVGLKCSKQEYINKHADLNTLFGFYYCDIKAPKDSYLCVLPLRVDTGIIFPTGEWSGMYFSEELKFAKENGYSINVKCGYSFEKVSNVFTNYVQKLYKMKSYPSNVTQKYLAKSLLNNLLGRFGMDFTKPITNIVNDKTFHEIALTRKITSWKRITDDDILISYSPEIDEIICNKFNVDVNKAILQNTIPVQNKESSFKGVSIPIAAAITAYGRIHINKLKLYILNSGGKIFYSDTDSIVTDIQLPNDMIDSKDIGKVKLEHKIKRGYFISSKTYCLITEEIINNKNKVVIKCKGVGKNKLTEKDFIDMYEGNTIKT
jgi:DNA polymerase elongation subunit (family B)